MKWELIYYQSFDGNAPVYEFIESLNPKAKAKVINALDLLSEFGINLGMPRVKKISGTELWELRVVGGDNIRIFYITMSKRTFLLLHGFVKKKQKTDRKEISTALTRLRIVENK